MGREPPNSNFYGEQSSTPALMLAEFQELCVRCLLQFIGLLAPCLPWYVSSMTMSLFPFLDTLLCLVLGLFGLCPGRQVSCLGQPLCSSLSYCLVWMVAVSEPCSSHPTWQRPCSQDWGGYHVPFPAVFFKQSANYLRAKSCLLVYLPCVRNMPFSSVPILSVSSVSLHIVFITIRYCSIQFSSNMVHMTIWAIVNY